MPGPYELDRDRLRFLEAVAKRIGFGIQAKNTSEAVRDIPTVTLTLRQRSTTRTDAANAGEFLKWAMQVADAIEEHGYEWDATDRYAIDSYDGDGCAQLGKHRFITVLLQAPKHWRGGEPE